jgi:spore germination protein GerM
MSGKRILIISLFLAFLVVLVLVFFRSGVEEKIKSSPEAPPSQPEPSAPKLERTKKVTLFFLSEEDALLHREEREIASDSSLVSQAKQTIEELIKGSKKGFVSPLPPETKLRELYLTAEGVAYVDFSEDIVQKSLSGSSAEISTIYSVVNSLAYNFNSIKKVFILVEGSERETLGGHINLSRPFLPLYDLVAD